MTDVTQAASWAPTPRGGGGGGGRAAAPLPTQGPGGSKGAPK